MKKSSDRRTTTSPPSTEQVASPSAAKKKPRATLDDGRDFELTSDLKVAIQSASNVVGQSLRHALHGRTHERVRTFVVSELCSAMLHDFNPITVGIFAERLDKIHRGAITSPKDETVRVAIEVLDRMIATMSFWRDLVASDDVPTTARVWVLDRVSRIQKTIAGYDNLSATTNESYTRAHVINCIAIVAELRLPELMRACHGAGWLHADQIDGYLSAIVESDSSCVRALVRTQLTDDVGLDNVLLRKSIDVWRGVRSGSQWATVCELLTNAELYRPSEKGENGQETIRVQYEKSPARLPKMDRPGVRELMWHRIAAFLSLTQIGTVTAQQLRSAHGGLPPPTRQA